MDYVIILHSILSIPYDSWGSKYRLGKYLVLECFFFLLLVPFPWKFQFRLHGHSPCYSNSTPDAEVACVESKCHDAAIITGIQQVFLSEFHYDELCMFKLPEDGY